METTTVAVVGAGAAGLACAAELRRRGVAVAVLEARERLGGRIRTLRVPGEPPLELGAQVIHGAAAVTWDVLRGARLQAGPQPEAPLRLAVGGRRLDADAAAAEGLELPWRVEAALLRARLGDVPARDAVHALGLSAGGRALALAWLAQRWAADPAELSAGGLTRRHAARAAGDGEFVVRDGYDRVAEALAAGLDVRLAAPLAAVRWEPGHVELDVAGGPLACRALVVTAPPRVAAGLRWEPDLPPVKRTAAAAIAPGDAVTVIGRADVPATATEWVLDADGPGGFWRSGAGSPLVAGWLKGPAAAAARAMRADGGRTRPPEAPADGGLTGQLAAAALPWVIDAGVTDVAVVDWGADPCALGAHTFPRVGAGDAPVQWALAVAATLFFAGDATCGDRHSGMVHGALESGLRAAGEVLRVLRP